jgi:hypothetical protein
MSGSVVVRPACQALTTSTNSLATALPSTLPRSAPSLRFALSGGRVAKKAASRLEHLLIELCLGSRRAEHSLDGGDFRSTDDALRSTS